MIEAGDILLVRGNRPVISRLIRWVTDSPYTHAGVAVSEEHIYEIDIDKKLGIHTNNHESYDVYRYRHGLTFEQKARMQAHAIDQSLSNRGYDWLRILSFGFNKLFRTKRTFDWANRVVCSEIVDILYAEEGIDLIPWKENGHVTPGELAHSPELIKVFSSTGASHK